VQPRTRWPSAGKGWKVEQENESARTVYVVTCSYTVNAYVFSTEAKAKAFIAQRVGHERSYTLVACDVDAWEKKKA
jgi:hypothetical protein